jgi:hypothetical protein
MSPTFTDSKTLQQMEPGIGIQSRPVIEPLYQRMYFTYHTSFEIGNPPVRVVERGSTQSA